MALTGTFTGVGIAPSVTSATMTGSIVRVVFSEPLNPVPAIINTNYTIAGISVLKAEIEPLSNNSVVLLTVSGYSPNTNYTVVVSANITDKAGNPVT